MNSYLAQLSEVKGDGTYLISPEGGLVDYTARWSGGYIVGIKALELRDLKPYALVGIWTDEGDVVQYDLVRHLFTDVESAKQLARENDQTHVYCLREEKVIAV